MYMFATIQTGVHWAIIRDAFITHGISSDDTVNALTGPTFTMVVLPATLLVANTFLADCVLVRRENCNFLPLADSMHCRSLDATRSGTTTGG
jgi:hypothetical protein